MRRMAFSLAILGTLILLFFFQSKPIPFNATENLTQFQPNQKLMIQGKVIEESYTEKYKILNLDSKIKLQCPRPCPSFLNQNIQALVILEKYNNKDYLKVLKIKTNP